MEQTRQRKRPDMEAFFEARSVAILGASPEFHKPNGRPIEALLEKGYKGQIYPVNPKYDSIAGFKCYPAVTDIPGAVELAVMGVSGRAAVELASQCIQKGVKGMVILSSGFAETGEEGRKVERELARMCRESGMRIMGPNCLGMVNNLNGLWAGFSDLEGTEEERYLYPNRFSLISQSGFFGERICSYAADRGVGFNHFASVGNQADLSFTDFLEYIVDDPGTRIASGYIEGLKQGPLFMETAREALRKEKPVIVMKVGQTGAGVRAVSSHTGSLAGSDRIYDAAFRQTGIIRAEGMEQLVSALTFAAGGRWPRGNRVAIVSSAGGASVIMSDQCDRMGLDVVELSPETRKGLDEVLPYFGSSANPVDLTAQLIAIPEMLFKCLKLVMEDPNVDMVIAHFRLRDELVNSVADQFENLYQQIGKPMVVITLPISADEEMDTMTRKLSSVGFPVIKDMDSAIWAASAMARWASRLKHADEKPPLPPPGREKEKALSIIRSAGSRYLTEYRASEILRAYGIDTPRGTLAFSAGEAVARAEEIGYPVVLKVQSPDILHKTDAGGLAVNLSSAGEVKEAYNRVSASVRRHSPDARLEGLLVQEMLPQGTEAIIGLNHDEVFGPTIMFGLGGIFVEVLEDVSFRVAPLTRTDTREMIRELRGYRVFEGVRGTPPSDLEALEDILLKVSRLAVELSGEIAEMDINPLFVFPRGRGVAVADALITLKEENNRG